MATAESPRGDAPQAATEAPGGGGPGRDTGRRWIWGGLGLVLAGGLGLRLWGIRQGLPYAYNADEADHFVPHAIAMFREQHPAH